MKLTLKTELKIVFFLLFIIPALDILIFKATTSLFSAMIIMISLVIFFLTAIISIDRITERLEELRTDAIEEEKTYRNLMDSASADLDMEIDEITDTLSGLDSSNKTVKKALNKLENISSKIHKISRIEYKGIKIDRTAHTVRMDDKALELTPIEFELLWVFMQKRDHVMQREYLLDRIWGYDYFGNTRTVDMSITRLRKKLGKNSELIQTVKGLGYKFS